MNTFWWEGPRPETKFAPNFKVPVYVAKDGSQQFVKDMIQYVLDVERNIIEHEELVSPVPKSGMDPYKHTQQWKQHNLLDDIPGHDGEHLKRFPKHPCIEELFNLVRINYLTHLANLRYPRRKVFIHGWANVLRNDEWISMHTHSSHTEAYLSSTYYLTSSPASLYLANPSGPMSEHTGKLDKVSYANWQNLTVAQQQSSSDMVEIKTEARKIVFFPSWIPHWSEKQEGENLRISLAFDIVTENTALGNHWRPHRLLDDPATMPGLEG